MGLCGLSLMNEFELRPIYPTLNISQRAVKHMESLHLKWMEKKCEKSPGATSTHIKTVALAFIVGIAAAVIPWFILKYRDLK